MPSDGSDTNCGSFKYSSGVLIGCWFNERFGDEAQQMGNRTGSGRGRWQCEQHESIYRAHYRQRAAGSSSLDATAAYTSTKQQAFANFMMSRVSNIKFYDNAKYLNNMTTTSDLRYRIQPEDVRKRVATKFRKTEFDGLQSYGNATNTGYRNNMEKQVLNAASERKAYTTYQTSYNAQATLAQAAAKAAEDKETAAQEETAAPAEAAAQQETAVQKEAAAQPRAA